MRRIILGVAVSLDGFIEGPNGEYDWCFSDQDYGMKEFMARIDTILYGRKTFEMMVRDGFLSANNPYEKMDQYVFSNTLTNVDGMKLAKIGDINPLKTESGKKDIWLFGGAAFTSSLMNLGLVDELWLSVHPILLGKGKPLFEGLTNRVKTELIDTKTYSTGLVSMTHNVVH